MLSPMTDGAVSVPPAPEEQFPHVNPQVYRFVVDVTFLPVLLSGMRLDIHGREHVPPPGTPLVVAANHQSALDPFLIARALPPGRFLQFMAKRELFVPVIGDIIRAGGSFPVDRDGSDVKAIRTSLRILKANGTVGIFPQGTRGGQEIHGGAALIAARGRAPILPAGISRDGRRWVIRFGEPISARGGIKANTEELARRLQMLSQPVGRRV
ncbi:1-acyl-sn-glycerol-3-phosphate acyltransferase [Deinococcus wulumuqiensis R12]|uniref:1-acyl-sn-glycerol-3-phosphate acyltransferase n=2 Tax=Deinococcus wulumuqiensis TaxID=980427 RepID=A0AAV4K598_9DEIO|nr:1-acyl-sn-glycerol-3-phosphate acyltransferase [Deinococcus wulumuqiensis R12]GGI78304.1 1-acyl-sn-glycerol-3-phosphate acyltransferase [Deinococcus wulumuqiensis]GGP30559.1 1-acyl-sn-glycerol-3-phosphate acyltransferase [Deinococcus wulumuqiensis]